MNGIDTSGKALVEFWKAAAEKGLMNPNTANSLRAASHQILGIEKGWENLDIRAINVDDLTHRFQNKRHGDFKPKSLETYKKRFSQAVTEFLAYANDPSSWKAPSLERRGRKGKKTPVSGNGGEILTSTPERPPVTPTLVSGLVEYPFPLREGRFAYLRLPVDLRLAEVKRLTAYLTTLAVDSETAA